MRNTLFVLCEDVTVDSKTNQWILFKHIEKINLSVPAKERKEGQIISVKGKFNLVSFWDVKEKEETEIKYLFVDESGDTLVDTPGYKLEGKENPSTLKHRLILDRVPVKDSGRYYFKIFKREGGSYQEEAQMGIDIVVDVKEEIPQEEKPQGESPQGETPKKEEENSQNN